MTSLTLGIHWSHRKKLISGSRLWKWLKSKQWDCIMRFSELNELRVDWMVCGGWMKKSLSLYSKTSVFKFLCTEWIILHPSMASPLETVDSTPFSLPCRVAIWLCSGQQDASGSDAYILQFNLLKWKSFVLISLSPFNGRKHGWGGNSTSTVWIRRTLKWNSVVGWIASPPNSYAEVLTISTSECHYIW